MARRFALNFWSCTYNVTVSNEAELRARAESIAKERGIQVAYFEAIDGRSVLLGVVPRPERPVAAVSAPVRPPAPPEDAAVPERLSLLG